MKAMVCEMCGSSDLVKQEGLYVCQNCGTKYTVEEARKLLGTVKIDKSDETENLMILANRALKAGGFSEAKEYYEQVLRNNANHCDALIRLMYCKAMLITPIEIVASMERTTKSLYDIFSVIGNLPEYSERDHALNELISYSLSIAETYKSWAKKVFSLYSDDVFPHNKKEKYYDQCIQYIRYLYQYLEANLKRLFPYDTQRINDILNIEYKYLEQYKKYLALKHNEFKATPHKAVQDMV